MKLYRKKPKYGIGDIVIVRTRKEKKFDLLAKIAKIVYHSPHSQIYNYRIINPLNNPYSKLSNFQPGGLRWTYKSNIKGIPLKKDLIFDLL